MKLLPIALLLLTALPTLARLGETKAECETRYGKPLQSKDTSAYFHKAPFMIKVTFWKGKAAVVTFIKTNPGDADGKEAPISEAERDVLLKANAGTSTWKEGISDKDTIVWLRADGNASAVYGDESKLLTISDAAYDAITDKTAADQQPAPAPTSDDFPRLRETKAQLEKRCGPPIKTISDTRLVYRKSGYTITATFWKGKAGEYTFQSEKTATDPFAEDDKATVAAAMPEEDINAALKANIGSAKKWDEQEDDSDEGLDEKRWNRGDQKVFAVYRRKDSTLTLSDYEYLDYVTHLQQDLKEKEKTKNLDGF